MPSFAEPAVSRADAALNTLDGAAQAAERALHTEQGQKLVAAGAAVGRSLLLFAALLAVAALSCVEWAVGVDYNQTGMPCAGRRVRTVFEVVVGRVGAWVERRERGAEGSFEGVVYGKVRWIASVFGAVFVCVVAALAKYDGPASEFVAPFAARVQGLLPSETGEKGESGGDAGPADAQSSASSQPEPEQAS